LCLGGTKPELGTDRGGKEGLGKEISKKKLDSGKDLVKARKISGYKNYPDWKREKPKPTGSQGPVAT